MEAEKEEINMNEKENTFNTLANKPLLVSSFWCKFGFHNWEKWSDIKVACKPGYSQLTMEIQERYCSSCHLHSMRPAARGRVRD